MKKSTNTALIVFFILIVAVIPLYYYTRPDATQPAETIQVKGNVNNPTTLTIAQLESLPATTLQVTLSSSSHQEENGNFTYTGVSLKELLSQAQANSNATSVYVQASDGYGSTLTMQEARSQNTFIAYKRNGAALSQLKDGGEGPMRLIIGGDTYAQRWVRGVAAIEVS